MVSGFLQAAACLPHQLRLRSQIPVYQRSCTTRSENPQRTGQRRSYVEYVDQFPLYLIDFALGVVHCPNVFESPKSKRSLVCMEVVIQYRERAFWIPFSADSALPFRRYNDQTGLMIIRVKG